MKHVVALDISSYLHTSLNCYVESLSSFSFLGRGGGGFQHDRKLEVWISIENLGFQPCVTLSSILASIKSIRKILFLIESCLHIIGLASFHTLAGIYRGYTNIHDICPSPCFRDETKFHVLAGLIKRIHFNFTLSLRKTGYVSLFSLFSLHHFQTLCPSIWPFHNRFGL